MDTFGALTVEAFRWVVRTSWQASVLALLIVLVQMLFREKLSPGWRYGLWLLLVARLLMPMPPPSPLSIFNVAKLPEKLTIGANLPTEDTTSRPDVSLPYPESAPAPLPRFMDSLTEPTKPYKPMTWLDACIAFWLSGVCVFGIRLFVE